jgi:PQQ-like domain
MLALQRRSGPQLLISLLLLSGLFSTGSARSLAGETPRPATTGWKIKFDESGSSPVIVDGVLYIGSADGAIYALDPASGETKWRFQTGESLSPASSGPLIITVPKGTSGIDQMVAGMKAAEKQKEQGIRRVDMTPTVENGTVFVGSGDHSFYAIDAATGKKKWSYDIGYAMASNNNSSFQRNDAHWTLAEQLAGKQGIGPIAAFEALHLPFTQLQQTGGFAYAQPPARCILNHFHPLELFLTHRHHPYRVTKSRCS